MIINHDRRFIFICNGRTGTTSIESALMQFPGSTRLVCGASGLFQSRHIPPTVARELIGSALWTTYFKFAFFREPLDWIVSQYCWNSRYRINIGKILRHPSKSAKQLMSTRIRKRTKRTLETADIIWLYEHLKGYRGVCYADSLFQSTYVCDASGKIILDFVGLFDRIDDDVLAIGRTLGVHLEITRSNESTEFAEAKPIIDEEATLTAFKLYERDISLISEIRRNRV